MLCCATLQYFDMVLQDINDPEVIVERSLADCASIELDMYIEKTRKHIDAFPKESLKNLFNTGFRGISADAKRTFQSHYNAKQYRQCIKTYADSIEEFAKFLTLMAKMLQE